MRSTARGRESAEEWQAADRDRPAPGGHGARDVPTRLDSPYLFHSARGRRLSKGTLSYAFRVVRQRWARRERIELYELRHACATLLLERGLPPHVVANQLGHTDGGPWCSASTGTRRRPACATRCAWRSPDGTQLGRRRRGEALQRVGFLSVADPPSPFFQLGAHGRDFAAGAGKTADERSGARVGRDRDLQPDRAPVGVALHAPGT
jgi:integrase-like protein